MLTKSEQAYMNQFYGVTAVVKVLIRDQQWGLTLNMMHDYLRYLSNERRRASQIRARIGRAVFELVVKLEAVQRNYPDAEGISK